MPAISILTTPSLSTWTQGDTITAALLNGNNTALQTGVTNLNSAIADVEKHYAAASAPTDKPQGKGWYDTGNSLFKIYHTLNATAPAALLDTTYAYNQALATAGTATFKIAGKVTAITTAATSAAGATGVLMDYAVASDAVNAAGVTMQFVNFGTKVGASSAVTLQSRLGAVVLATHTFSAACTDWYIETWVVRRATATDPAVGSICVVNRDDTASTTLCHAATAASYTLDVSAANAYDVNVSSVGALDAMTQQTMVAIRWG